MHRLWRLWYWLYPVAPPPLDRGTRDNPLSWDDMVPLMTMLGRTRQVLDADGLHEALPVPRLTERTDELRPYVNEDGIEVYLRASDYTLNEARHEAASFAGEHIGPWGRSRYLGKRDVPLHDCGDDWWSCKACPAVPAWTFETYEGTYRG